MALGVGGVPSSGRLGEQLHIHPLRIQSSSATAQDSATRIPQLGFRNYFVGFRNWDSANWDSATRIPQLGFRN